MGAVRTPLLVSIGSTHPWNIAGTGLDAHVAREYGVDHAAVVAGITAQDESGLHEKMAVPAAMVQAQLNAVPAEIDAIRIGALLDAQTVSVVAAYVRAKAGVAAVVDPVLGASLGGAFADAAAYDALRAELFSLPVILTPNVPEAQLLTGRVIEAQEDALAAARTLLEFGPAAVLLKGGHLHGDPADVLITRSEVHVFGGTRLPGAMRGSGCVLAAALACELARGRPVCDAVEGARAFVRAKIAANKRRGTLQVAF